MVFEIGILFALASMFSWGTADFFAKKAVDRVGYVKSMLIVQVFALMPLAIYAFATSQLPAMSVGLLLVTSVAALGGVGGYYFFFKGLQKGNISIVSPVSSSYAIVPVVFSYFLYGEVLSPLQLAGIAAIFVGVFLASTRLDELRKSIREGATNGVFEALMATVTWGTTYTLLKIVVDGAGPVMGALVTRVIMMLFSIVLFGRGALGDKSKLPGRTILLFLVAAGFLDMIGLMSYNMGITTQLVSIVSPISAIYSAVTVVLAYIFLKERIANNQKAGIVSILAGLLLISIV